MSIENVKVKYIRLKGFQNLEEWMKDPNNVYIGRSGVVFINKQRFPKNLSIFCNPYVIGKHGNRDEVINLYRNHIIQKIEQSDNFKNQLISLKGKNLGCWCYPEPCHGDVLLELINKYSDDSN